MYYVNDKICEKVVDIHVFIKPLYEKLRQEGFSEKECLQIFELATKFCIVDEITK